VKVTFTDDTIPAGISPSARPRNAPAHQRSFAFLPVLIEEKPVRFTTRPLTSTSKAHFSESPQRINMMFRPPAGRQRAS
jgi:hypothetical protein